MPSIEELPPAFPAMWRVLRRGYQAEPRLLSVSIVLALLAALPDALLALWLKLLADGVLGHRPILVTIATLGLGASAVGTWFLRVVSTRIQRRFRDRISIALQALVARLQASVTTLEHHERPEYLDRLAVLRNQVFVLDHVYMSLFNTGGWIVRLGVTLGLLMAVQPVLALLVLFALPTVLTSSWRPGIERAAEERGASAQRRARHLFDLATTAAPGKEVRVTRLAARLLAQRREAWERWYGPVAAARSQSAAWYGLGWAIFAAGYVGAIVLVATRPGVSPSSVLLVLAAGARLSSYISATAGEIGFLRGFWLDGSRRLAWLEDYAASFVEHEDAAAPDHLSDGIRFENVSFTYPGTERQVLEDINLHVPSGSVVAIVGENGAGKTTLVKLLCRLYRPTSGRILVDGVDLLRVPPAAWRERLSGAFQDFYRFEFTARHSVGVGDLPRRDDLPVVMAAVERAGASAMVAELPRAIDTQLGVSWPAGVEVSFGQWQKLALARGSMREHALLLVLDEPTAALDAETEQALFERYAAMARGDGEGSGNGIGRVTILVSHRFSAVRMADFIVVLEGARVVESGSHEELMARQGQYAELYEIQAAAYR